MVRRKIDEKTPDHLILDINGKARQVEGEVKVVE